MKFICIKCNKDLKSNYNLKRHYNRKTPCNAEIIHKCDNCLHVFSCKAALSNHLSRKFPCKKVDPVIENYELKLEIEQLKNVKIVNNIINNNQQNIYNITINEGDKYYKNQLLHQIQGQYKIDKTHIHKLMLNKEHVGPDIKNISAFTDIIIKICFNIQRPENWRFIYDKISELLKIKLNDQIVDFPDYILEFIYSLYKQVVNSETVDPELAEFYKRYIKNYENSKYDNLDVDDFIKECYDGLIAQYMGMIDSIDRRFKIKEVTVLPIKSIVEFKLNIFNQEYIVVKKDQLERYQGAIDEIIDNENNYYEGDNFKYRGLKCTYEELPIYDVFVFIFKLIYCNKENRTIKYEDGSFMTHYEEGLWHIVDFTKLIEDIFNKIHEFLKRNRLVLNNELEDEYKIKYYLDDSSDYDDDDTEEDRKKINTTHLNKYRRMVQYLLNDPKFYKMIFYRVMITHN